MCRYVLKIIFSMVPTRLTRKFCYFVFAKTKPTKDSEKFSHCGNYQDMGCCNSASVDNIANWNSPDVLSLPYDECGKLSQECEKYILVSASINVYHP